MAKIHINARVKGRKMRHIDPNNRLHRLGGKNTTGAFGDKSTWNVRVSHARKIKPEDYKKMDEDRARGISVQTGELAKGRKRAAKRKNISRMFAGDSKGHYEDALKRMLLNLRNDIHTVSLIGNFTGQQVVPEHISGSMAKIQDHLLILMKPDEKTAMDNADKARFYSVKGMFEKGVFKNPAPMKKLWDRINRALIHTRDFKQRMVIPYTFKPEPSASFYVG